MQKGGEFCYGQSVGSKPTRLGLRGQRGNRRARPDEEVRDFGSERARKEGGENASVDRELTLRVKRERGRRGGWAKTGLPEHTGGGKGF